MTDRAKLEALIAAVEAGRVDWLSHLRGSETEPHEDDERLFIARYAFNGSLDAAHALHDALLPGWKKNLTFTEFADGSTVAVLFGPLPDDAGKWDFAPRFESRARKPARAWLLAVLRAKLAEGV